MAKLEYPVKWLGRRVLRATPTAWHGALRSARNRLVRLAMTGSACYCPICAHRFRRFVTGGVDPRPRAACPVCRSLKRHRLVWLYFQHKTCLFDGQRKRMLHVAPEKSFSKKLAQEPSLDYLSADLMSPSAMVRMDITDIQYADESFDVIYCSHVLEHVPEDRKAMAECFRVLRPHGWAVLLVPILRDTTYEDPTIQTPEERLRAFGQDDHVRIYGIDFQDRLEEAGFVVRADAYAKEWSQAERQEMGIECDDIIFFCRKPEPDEQRER